MELNISISTRYPIKPSHREALKIAGDTSSCEVSEVIEKHLHGHHQPDINLDSEVGRIMDIMAEDYDNYDSPSKLEVDVNSDRVKVVVHMSEDQYGRHIGG